MLDQPIQDKAVIAAGATASTLLSFQWLEAGLAVVVACMTALLLGMRIYLAWRDISDRNKPSSD